MKRKKKQNHGILMMIRRHHHHLLQGTNLSLVAPRGGENYYMKEVSDKNLCKKWIS